MTEIVANIFIVIAIGWLFRKYNLVGEDAEKAFNQYLFYLALPALTVIKIISTNFSGLGAAFIALNIAPILFLMAVSLLLWKTGAVDWKLARLLVIVSAMGNTVYLGFPIVAMRLGQEQIGCAAIVSSIQNVIIFTFGFYFTNLICAGRCQASSFKRLIGRNTVLWSSVTGIVISLLSLPIPAIAMDIMESIGKTTLPLALFTIGISLYGKSVSGNIRKLSLIAGMKLFALPLFCLLPAYLLDFKGGAARVVYLEMCMPVAVLNFVIAKEFDFDADLVSQSIIFTTLVFFPLLYLYDWVMTLAL